LTASVHRDPFNRSFRHLLTLVLVGPQQSSSRAYIKHPVSASDWTPDRMCPVARNTIDLDYAGFHIVVQMIADMTLNCRIHTQVLADFRKHFVPRPAHLLVQVSPQRP